MGVKATDRCRNCGREFADHNYIKDSITDYECPEPHVEMGYGYFCGGYPRDFLPDYESCTPEEIENHRKACEEANRSEAAATLACPSGWAGNVHILCAPFGIGGYIYKEPQYFQAAESEGVNVSD